MNPFDSSTLRHLLSDGLAPAESEALHAEARRVARSRFGTGVYVRALVEVTNVCRNDCLYCGIRRSNGGVGRYTLTPEEIVASCRRAYDAGLRTFVLQGGENPAFAERQVARVVEQLHRAMPEAAITLSLGEQSRDTYRRWRDAGATRYLLRHETACPRHYATLHPADMSFDHRMECLRTLRDLGYQVGTGMMVGTPGQTVDTLIRDLEFMADFRPEMIGIGPFLPHSATPLARCAPGELELTLRLVSILRLMHPSANIPSTTALATLHPEGRLRGVMAGANVVMPNVSPVGVRSRYNLYDSKAHTGAEAVEGLAQLAAQLDTIGYYINYDKGDYV